MLREVVPNLKGEKVGNPRRVVRKSLEIGFESRRHGPWFWKRQPSTFASWMTTWKLNKRTSNSSSNKISFWKTAVRAFPAYCRIDNLSFWSSQKIWYGTRRFQHPDGHFFVFVDFGRTSVLGTACHTERGYSKPRCWSGTNFLLC